jgi:hypothetical protein
MCTTIATYIPIYFYNIHMKYCNIPLKHLTHSKHTLATFTFKHNIYLLLGRMEARCRAGQTYQQHAGGGTSSDDVPADIHHGECMQEIEGGEADKEVAWLARWRATRDGSPRLLSYGRDELEKGAAGDFLRNYEPKAALVELGVGRKRTRRKGSNGDWGAPSLVGPVRVCEQQLEREREA